MYLTFPLCKGVQSSLCHGKAPLINTERTETMSAVDALGITLSNNPEMSAGSFKKLRDLEGAGSGDFTAVITAKISTSIHDLKSAGQERSASVSSINEISSPAASKNESASFGGTRARIKETAPSEKKDAISSYDGKVKDAVEKFERDVKEEIKKVLDVSDEEIEEAMEELSLSYIDLSDVSKLSMLFMKLSGISDQSELLLTDGFSQLKNSVFELSGELFSATGLGMEELNAAQNMIVAEDGNMISLENEGEAETTNAPILSEQTEPSLAEKDALSAVEVQSDENTATTVRTEDSLNTPADGMVKEEGGEKGPAGKTNEADAAAPIKATSSDGTKEAIVSGDEKNLSDVKTSSKDASPEDIKAKPEGRLNEPVNSTAPDQNQNPLSGQNQRENEFASNSNILSNNAFAAEGTMETPEIPVTPYSQQGINPAEIARQMISGVRTVVTESLKTMELQLNPENLGKMIIHVSEQDGQLTARINIQNENVKTAMEEQMAIVKNNLEAQGLKIESVTVTADAHEFERNLEEGNAPKNDMNSQEGRQADADPSEGNDGRRQGVRSLNMNELESGDITDLNEDELLAARIMKENGSTLNINA